ncbi:sigma-70 family RNA polymerase sigma factor [Pseudomonas sp. TE3610]
MPTLQPPNLTTFFTAHHRWLLRHVYQRLRHPQDAQDTAADTFVELLTARTDPAAIAQPRAYLSTIARRLIFHRFRRKQLETAYLERLSQLPEALAPSPEETLALLQALEAIELSLGGLPPVVKAAFLYSQLDDLSYADIGWRLGVSERTVTRYIKQALRHCYLAELAL